MVFLWIAGLVVAADNWPRWRGPDGNAVATGSPLPVHWNNTQNIRWKAAIPGEGSSSPIVWEDRVFVTSALEDGKRRLVHCLDRGSGKLLWTGEVRDPNPERTSSLTGHAAATPATDGKRVVAFFGNAGAVCFDPQGEELWRRSLGEFDSELGLASSPVIHRERVFLVCDHDGDRFTSFDSFLVSLDLATGAVRWKTERRGLFRSWSTPVLVPNPNGRPELIVNAQDRLRAYDPETGKELWQVAGMTGWVTPSPVFGQGLIFATSGRHGPVIAFRSGGEITWQHANVGPYVCSPLLYGDYLYVHNEQGILTCYAARTGAEQYRERLPGKFTASAVAGDGKIYVTNEEGTTHVLKAGANFEVLARNPLQEFTLASPAVAGGDLFIRSEKHVWCIRGGG